MRQIKPIPFGIDLVPLKNFHQMTSSISQKPIYNVEYIVINNYKFKVTYKVQSYCECDFTLIINNQFFFRSNKSALSYLLICDIVALTMLVNTPVNRPIHFDTVVFLNLKN